MTEAVTAALVALAEANIPTDVQELLIRGNPDCGIAPGALVKALTAARKIYALAPQVSTNCS